MLTLTLNLSLTLILTLALTLILTLTLTVNPDPHQRVGPYITHGGDVWVSIRWTDVSKLSVAIQVTP